MSVCRAGRQKQNVLRPANHSLAPGPMLNSAALVMMSRQRAAADRRRWRAAVHRLQEQHWLGGQIFLLMAGVALSCFDDTQYKKKRKRLEYNTEMLCSTGYVSDTVSTALDTTSEASSAGSNRPPEHWWLLWRAQEDCRNATLCTGGQGQGHGHRTPQLHG